MSVTTDNAAILDAKAEFRHPRFHGTPDRAFSGLGRVTPRAPDLLEKAGAAPGGTRTAFSQIANRKSQVANQQWIS